MRLQIVAFLFSTILAVGVHSAPGPQFAKDLNEQNSKQIDVIIQFKHSHKSNEKEDDEAIRQVGGVFKAELDLIDGGLYSVPANRLEHLSKNPNVLYISQDRPLTSLLNNPAPAVNANIAWSQGWDGTGIGVAVIDSGVSNDKDFQISGKSTSRISYSQAFYGGAKTYDEYGHGTHVAGIVASSGTNSTGSQYIYTFKGIAPNANLINLRALDQNGSGTDSTVISAIQAAIQLKSKYNIRVINLSLGRPVFESYKIDPLCQAVESAWRAGIVVVVAAGNSGRNNTFGTYGYGTITAPGNDPFIITVGAMKTMATYAKSDDLIASYSSKGPSAVDHIVKPDVVAPGNQVVSLLSDPGSTLADTYQQTQILRSYYVNGQGNSGDRSSSYFRLSGTSMA